MQAADHWVASREEHSRSDDRFRFENELSHITQARVYLAQNKPRASIDLLAHVEAAARSAGRMGHVIEILPLRALALHQIGDPEQALLVLTECLNLAEPEGYVRIFVDAGRPMRILLVQWLAHAGAGSLRDYAIRLLSHFDAEPDEVPASHDTASPAGDLVEPLSPREIEVLHLIALGRTNREIAEQLIIALGTVKAHTSSIYRKLDVANRTEAVARARQIGVLPSSQLNPTNKP
jgi:LuxR family maltose regulon positive regulatory protein